jgi:molybdate-binding protein
VVPRGQYGPAAQHGDVYGPQFEVAMTVASGTAGVGVATRAAASAFALDFAALAWEPFELALPVEALELAAARSHGPAL